MTILREIHLREIPNSDHEIPEVSVLRLENVDLMQVRKLAEIFSRVEVLNIEDWFIKDSFVLLTFGKHMEHHKHIELTGLAQVQE